MKQHGLTDTPTWNSWRAMMKRCYQPTSADYHLYGGKGVTVCKEWHEFTKFLRDMGERPANTSLNRKDNSENYCKENCEWATPIQQAKNRSTNRLMTVNGVTLIAKDMAKLHKINQYTVISRLDAGYSDYDAIFKPLIKRLTKSEKKHIKSLAGQMSQEKIGAMFGIQQASVSRIIRS